MSKYQDLVNDFFMRYERPVLEDLVIGFSGIDPPLKQTGGGGTTNHEELDNLLGGDNEGHYHLTYGELEKLKELLTKPEPEPEPEPEDDEYDGGFSNTSEAEYEKNKSKWLDGGYAGSTHEKSVDGGRANT